MLKTKFVGHIINYVYDTSRDVSTEALEQEPLAYCLFFYFIFYRLHRFILAYYLTRLSAFCFCWYILNEFIVQIKTTILE